MSGGPKIFLAAFAALVATVAQAQAPGPSGVHQHDGVFLRLDAGLGYERQRQSFPGGDLDVSGGAGAIGVAVGGAVVENLILAGHLFALGMSNPSISLAGTSRSGVTSAALVGLGPQLTVYFMPVNVYLSGTVAVTRISTRTGGVDVNSEWGGGLQLAVGKEWWVSDNWGLGLAAQVFGSANGDDSAANAPTIKTGGAALVFSATYN